MVGGCAPRAWAQNPKSLVHITLTRTHEKTTAKGGAQEPTRGQLIHLGILYSICIVDTHNQAVLRMTSAVSSPHVS
jgi:hypothetical protein